MENSIGIQRMGEILGEGVSQKVIEEFNKISPDFCRYVVNFAYGDIYARKKVNTNFDDRAREVAAVSSLITQGLTGGPLKSHIKGMLRVGWKNEDVIELIIFLIPYVGIPKCVEALRNAVEIFK